MAVATVAMLQLHLQLPMFIFILCFIWHLQADARWPSSRALVPSIAHLTSLSQVSLSFSWAQEQRIHLVITWHLNGSGRYQSPVYLNSSHMLLKTGSILQRCPLAERDRRQLPRLVYLLREGLGLGLTAFLHASVDLIRFLLWAQRSNTQFACPGRERDRESCAVCVCSVPHLELKETLRKTQSTSELPSFACVLLIFQHFQEYQQCLPYNKHWVKCFSFRRLPLLPLSSLRFSPFLRWSFLQFDWNRELALT